MPGHLLPLLEAVDVASAVDGEVPQVDAGSEHVGAAAKHEHGDVVGGFNLIHQPAEFVDHLHTDCVVRIGPVQMRRQHIAGLRHAEGFEKVHAE